MEEFYKVDPVLRLRVHTVDRRELGSGRSDVEVVMLARLMVVYGDGMGVDVAGIVIGAAVIVATEARAVQF